MANFTVLKGWHMERDYTYTLWPQTDGTSTRDMCRFNTRKTIISEQPGRERAVLSSPEEMGLHKRFVMAFH